MIIQKTDKGNTDTSWNQLLMAFKLIDKFVARYVSCRGTHANRHQNKFCRDKVVEIKVVFFGFLLLQTLIIPLSEFFSKDHN